MLAKIPAELADLTPLQFFSNWDICLKVCFTCPKYIRTCTNVTHSVPNPFNRSQSGLHVPTFFSCPKYFPHLGYVPNRTHIPILLRYVKTVLNIYQIYTGLVHVLTIWYMSQYHMSKPNIYMYQTYTCTFGICRNTTCH